MRLLSRPSWLLAVVVSQFPSASLVAQTLRPLSRRDAHVAALQTAPAVALAAGGTALANADLRTARLFDDPTLAVGYSKSVPSYHYAVELPLPLPWSRQPRINAAEQRQAGAGWRAAFQRTEAQQGVDAAYSRAAAASALAQLSARSARDMDSLLVIVRLRFAAGDASALDVDLAEIAAAQQRNLATTARLASDDALFALQAAMGWTDREIVVRLTDSLTTPDAPRVGTPGTPLLVAAAEAEARAAQFTVTTAHRDRLGTPALTAGFEQGDPDHPGALPTVGVALPLPLWNRNQGNIARARAEQSLADATVAAARVESTSQLARATRAWQTAITQVTQDAPLLAAAERVSAMSLTAYREGAAALSSVLEAQRNARDVRAQSIDHLLSAWLARSAVALFAETTIPDAP